MFLQYLITSSLYENLTQATLYGGHHDNWKKETTDYMKR